jgi:hypothetical protein
MDSSSTSSESVGNVSSSSSSSFGGWNKTKPLIIGMSAINGLGITNRMAQTISLTGDSYSIGKVFCYFYGPYGNDKSYTIHLEVYTCNDSGEPLNLLTSQALAGSSIVGNGWYSFEINLSGATPANKYLSFVVWQENGDEDNYILWGYYFSASTAGTKALFSNDGITWQYQSGAIRSLKLIGDFDAYDLNEFRILTPPAARECKDYELAGGTNDGTKIVNGSYQYSPEKVIIDNPSLITSFVVDSSGSMGWNDRMNTRKDFVDNFVQKLQQKYPSPVLFDIVKFGAQVANVNSVTANIGFPTTIMVDLTSPTRTAFSFRTQNANATKGDVYSNNSYSFTVLDTIVSESLLTCSGDGDSIPFTAGTLVRVSGSGDLNVEYESFLQASLSDEIVAYGFKNMEEDQPCNISTMEISGITYETSLTNWQSLSAGGYIALSLGSNGPRGIASIDFTSSENLVLRRPIMIESLATSKITSNASYGSNVVSVENTSVFNIGDKVDFVDKDLGSIGHTISNVSSTTLTVQPDLVFNISSWDNNGGIAQISNIDRATSITGTTANILFRDSQTTRNITFYVQTVNGLSMEWEIAPFSQWYINNLYWMGETALIPISVYDVYNNPFPDGTKIFFYVGGYPSDSNSSREVPSQAFLQDASIGADKIYLLSNEGFLKDQSIDVLDNIGNIQSVIITEVGDDTVGDYVKIDPLLQYNFTLSNGAKIVPSATDQDAANASSQISQATLLSSGLSLVDITPIYTGESLDPSLLQPYDLPPTDPSATYSDLNTDQERIRQNMADIPSIEGYAALRILPITEDNLKTVNEKVQESARSLRAQSPLIFTDQTEQNQGDIQQVEGDVQSAVSNLTTTTTTMPPSKGDDYNIDNPVYLVGGSAQSSMTTFATQLEEISFEGLNIPGVDPAIAQKMLVKKYDIYPAIVVETDNGTSVAKQFFTPFEIYFTPPVKVCSEYEGGQVSFVVPKQQDTSCPNTFLGYETITTDGAYASDDGFKINYVVTNRANLPASGQITIRMYSNTVIDLAETIRSGNAVTRQDFNVILPKIEQVVDGQTVITQPLTEISAWREAVENNPASQVIESASADDDSSGQRNTVISQAKTDLRNAGYVNPTSTTESDSFEYYTNPWEWTKAVQYDDIQEVTIDIVNGVASLDVPSSDISSLLMIQASVYFGDNNEFEFIRSDVFPVANPIDINAISPLRIVASGGNITYEIGTSVTWYGQPIADNVWVSFMPEVTAALSSTSKTDSGWAGGVYLGPHDLVKMTCPSDLDPSSTCPCYGELEDISVEVSYLGYTKKVLRTIEWISNVSSSEEIPEDEFYFHVNANGTYAFSDGSSASNMTIDLNDSENELWIESQSPFDGNNRLRMKGYQQGENNLPRGINVYTNRSYPSLVSTQSQRAWIDDMTYIQVIGFNQNIGFQQPLTSRQQLNPFTENLPWFQNVRITSSYKYYDSGSSSTKTRFQVGLTDLPYYVPDPSSITGGTILVIPYPSTEYREPLSITISLEAYGGEFIRDNIVSPNIVAEVKWEGQFISDKFVKNRGQLDETTIPYPFPEVVFEAGICAVKNFTPADPGEEVSAIDTRNLTTGCLTIGHHPDVSLSSYSVVVSLSRTDIYDSGTGTHTHSCSVDSNGNGSTESTIPLSGEIIEDHVHVISNYVALNSGTPIHQHSLRSVAITRINPLVNSNVDIAINGYVVYDPTNCTPYQNDYGSPLPSTFSKGNRMMFATLYDNSKVQNRTLLLSMTAGHGYTAESVTGTDRGINIVVSARFSQYSVEDSPGHWVIIPEKPVNDGTRVIFNVDCYRPSSESQSNDLLVVRTDAVRKYMYIRVKATVYAEELQESVERIIIVSSNLQWIPFVGGLVIEPTNDNVYLASAINQINTVGASQIYDGVKLAAQRLIQFQTDNPSWKDAKKVIFLLTDGDENSSQYSLQQSIDNVNFIDGTCEVPVVPVRLGYSFGSDDIVLGQYAEKTCGSVSYMINATSSEVLDIIDDIVTGSGLSINKGFYANTIDLGSDNLASSFSVENLMLPINSRVLFRARFSSDNTVWTAWTEWYDSSIVKELALDIQFKGRYFQYQIYLYGNENFESPELYAGLHLCHYVAQTFTVFFQPVDLNIDTDEYLASIHITHRADIPLTSTVNYGYAQFNTTEITDYASTTRPWITPDRHTIILSRYNELLLTNNYQKYTAINGGWPDGAIVNVYKISSSNVAGELVPATSYALNNKTGDVTFYNANNKGERFVICIDFDPVFRIVCNVSNYGPDPVAIDHIGVLYNISKRIPKTNGGTIIHTLIGDRI